MKGNRWFGLFKILLTKMEILTVLTIISAVPTETLQSLLPSHKSWRTMALMPKGTANIAEEKITD